MSLQRAAQACALPFAVVVNEAKAVTWLKQNSPQTKVLFRVTGDDWGIGAWKVEKYLPLLKSVPADWFSLANEWLDDSSPEALAVGVKDYIDALDYAYAMHVPLVVGDFTTHHPDLSRPGMLDALRPLIDRALLSGAPFNVHVYLKDGKDGDPGVWQQLLKAYPLLDIIIGELGILGDDGRMTPEGFANLLRYDELLTDQIIGCGLYSLTDQTWSQCDFASQLDAYAEHVKEWR